MKQIYRQKRTFQFWTKNNKNKDIIVKAQTRGDYPLQYGEVPEQDVRQYTLRKFLVAFPDVQLHTYRFSSKINLYSWDIIRESGDPLVLNIEGIVHCSVTDCYEVYDIELSMDFLSKYLNFEQYSELVYDREQDLKSMMEKEK